MIYFTIYRESIWCIPGHPIETYLYSTTEYRHWHQWWRGMNRPPVSGCKAYYRWGGGYCQQGCFQSATDAGTNVASLEMFLFYRCDGFKHYSCSCRFISKYLSVSLTIILTKFSFCLTFFPLTAMTCSTH